MTSYSEIYTQAKPLALASVNEWPKTFEEPYDEDDEPIILIADTARHTVGKLVPEPLSLEEIITSLAEEPNLLLVDFVDVSSHFTLQEHITNAILEAAARRVINEIAEEKGIEDRLPGIEFTEPTATIVTP